MKKVDDTPAVKLTLYSDAAEFTSAVDALYERLRLLGTKKKEHDLQALNTILCQLVVRPRIQRVGLASDDFTGNPLGIGWRAFNRTFYALVRYGYISIVSVGYYFEKEGIKPENRKQTRFEPTAKVLEFIKEHGLHQGMVRNEKNILTDLIILRDSNGNLISYKDTPAIKQKKANLRHYNDCLARSNITFDYSRCSPPAWIDHSDISYHRVFNRGSFDLGGRYWGTWWIDLPRVLRQYILIENEPVIELDYQSMLVQLLYLKETGKCFDGGDPYVIPGFEFPNGRDDVRAAFIRAYSSKSYSSFVKAMRKYTRFDCNNFPLSDIPDIVDLIKEQHKPISKFMFTDISLTLQRMEASISENIIMQLLDRGIIVLDVHDSFIVKEEYGEILEEVMNRELLAVRR